MTHHVLTACLLLLASLPACSSGIRESELPKEHETVNLDGKHFVICGNSMVYYGGLVQFGAQGMLDPGMFYRLLLNHGVRDMEVYDCTFGGHHLCDFGESGCRYSEKHGSSGTSASGGCPGMGHDLLTGIDFEKTDYAIISEAGNNYPHFFDDAKALFKRFSSVNPGAKLIYINHIYSVYKKHENVLGKLQALHDSLGVTIVNCGQLAYDMYTGKVKVPGGAKQYSDRFTFCNHTDSDTYHPNPLMGYIMTQMLYCAITGETASGEDYKSLVENSRYSGGRVSYQDYYAKYYSVPATLPFMEIIEDADEMKGIQELIPMYINRYR